MANDFKDSLNLPQTGFPMRGDLARREPQRLEFWEKTRLYERMLENNADGPTYILHDGPPYANGDIHLGTALNKILKDIVVRYKTMRGHRAPYVPGFDCHGLPIEQKVVAEVGPAINDLPATEIRERCAAYATRYVGLQSSQFHRLGVLGTWDKPYITMDPTFEVGELKVLRDLVARGLIRRGFRSVHWDPVFRTALAEAEIEYHPHVSDSIYVKFPLIDSADIEPVAGLDNVSLVIWTTTPWTLPANLGVCLNPELEYVALEHEGQHYVVAAGLAESFVEACGLEGAQEVRRFEAGPFDRRECAHPIFPERRSLVMLAEHVTLEQGTGCVHTAPGHGHDDFIIGQEYGLPVVVPVDDRGCFTDEFPAMAGTFVFDANPRIIEFIDGRGILLASSKVEHDYPHSWRSKKPILFRATEQWFMEVELDGVKERALKAVDEEVRWVPSWGHERMRGMVANRPAWCISRQRSWGVPIPSVRSKKSGESILDERIIDRFIEHVAEEGTDAWFRRPVEDFIPEGFVHEPTGERDPADFEKETDILDVWFDSGSSHVAVLEEDDRLRSPADIYLEGSDQHRGWFQAALWTSIGARDRAPYSTVVTHGYVLDGDGRAMSKSVGNTISPLDVIQRLGADNLRLWVASVDYMNDVRASDEILQRITETYRLIRNTLRFQVSNLYDFSEADALPVAELSPIDRWVLQETAELADAVTGAYEAFEFARVYQLVNRFCATTLSATYHDIVKDRLYTFAARDPQRRSAQTAIAGVFSVLNRLLAPILLFTSDEAHGYALENSELTEDSVHLQSWPEIPDSWRDERLATDVEAVLLPVRQRVNEVLEGLRKEKTIGKSLEARVRLSGAAESREMPVIRRYEAILSELFIVSSVDLESDGSDPSAPISVTAEPAPHDRCPRCWRRVPDRVETPLGPTCGRCAEAIEPTGARS